MPWHPPKIDLVSLSHEGLNRLLDRVDRSAVASPICTLDDLDGRPRVYHYGGSVPIPRAGEECKSSASACELGICTRLEKTKGDPKGGTTERTMRVLKNGCRPVKFNLHRSIREDPGALRV